MSSPKGLKAFFDTSGIRVNHIGMSGNAETFAKLKLSGTAQYDLFEADGLWPVRYQQEGMIEPIDLESIPNVAKNLHPEFKRIPGAAGGRGQDADRAVGLEPDGPDLQQEQGHVAAGIVRGPARPEVQGPGRLQRPARVHVAGRRVPARLPGTVQDEQGPARQGQGHPDQIKRNAPTISKGWNEQLRLYVEETVWIGLSSPGRAMTDPGGERPTMGWERPKEGYFGWIDGDMLVKGSPNRDAALAWINHIHSPSTSR
jgi:spermidine/putrescine-binding protein